MEEGKTSEGRQEVAHDEEGKSPKKEGKIPDCEKKEEEVEQRKRKQLGLGRRFRWKLNKSKLVYKIRH